MMNNNLFDNDSNEILQWGVMSYLYDKLEKDSDTNLTLYLNQITNQITIIENLIDDYKLENRDTKKFVLQLLDLEGQKRRIEGIIRERKNKKEEQRESVHVLCVTFLILTVIATIICLVIS